MIQEDRALWKYIVFGILTCGIYTYYFIYKMAMDVNKMCADDGKKTSGLIPFILLSFLTCGIYAYFWYYSLGNRLQANAPRYGLNFQENGTTVLLWCIFGLLLCGFGALVGIHILIKNTNEMAKAYNRLQNGQTPYTPDNQPTANASQTAWQQPVQAQPVQQNFNQPAQNTGVQQESGYCSDETVLLNPQQTQRGQGILYFVTTRQTVTIDKDEFKLGKNAASVDYVIPNDTSISRQHAVIHRQNGQFFITDLSSTNGTFINNQRITGTAQLQDGDNIRFADAVCVFNILR